MKLPTTILLVVPLTAMASSGDDAAIRCEQLFAEAMTTDMSLSYEAFDQTPGEGFRRLAERGCPGEAADLIEAYITATGATQRSLVWHVAQLRAEQGDYDSALRHARLSLVDEETARGTTLRWNDYVLGVIAFLERDKPALRRYRARVAEGDDEHPGNGMNGRVLDALIDGFDQDYSDAIAGL